MNIMNILSTVMRKQWLWCSKSTGKCLIQYSVVLIFYVWQKFQMGYHAHWLFLQNVTSMEHIWSEGQNDKADQTGESVKTDVSFMSGSNCHQGGIYQHLALKAKRLTRFFMFAVVDKSQEKTKVTWQCFPSDSVLCPELRVLWLYWTFFQNKIKFLEKCDDASQSHALVFYFF